MFELFETCKGRTDIYIAFIEQSIKILSKNGFCSFIIPYSYTNQNYATLSREYIVNNFSVQEIFDTSEYMIFENATVKNIIIRIKKNQFPNSTIIKKVSSAEDFINNNVITKKIVTKDFLKLKNCRFDTNSGLDNLRIKEIMDKNSKRLEELCFIAYGVRVNNKTDSSKPKEYYISQTKKANYSPFVEGKNISRYSFTQYGWLNYCPKEHYNPMFRELFESEKIMFINVVSDRLRFAYDTDGFFNSHTVINCVKLADLKNVDHISVKRAIEKFGCQESKKIELKYILGILNSIAINWYFLSFQSEGLHFYPDDAKKLPIPCATIDQQKPIIELVNKILSIKKKNSFADTSTLESQIDELVFDLYGLTDEEKSKILGQ